MFKNTLTLVLALIVSGQAFGSRHTDSLLKVLDRDIEAKAIYENQKRGRLATLYNNVGMSDSDESKLLAIKQLFEEYRNFSMDTTLMLAREGKRLANVLGNDRYTWVATLMESEALKGLGCYQMALDALDELPSQAIDSLALEVMYRRASIYNSLTEMPMPKSDIIAYRDSLMRLRLMIIENEEDELSRIITQIELLKDQDDNQGAIDYFNSIGDIYKADGQSMADLNFIIGEAYHEVGYDDTALEYLLAAAIDDIRNSDRRYNSLPLVAKILYDRGDLQRAYDYIICSLSDIRAANAQSRMYRINEALPIITNAYNLYQKQGHKNRQSAWLIVALIVVLMIAMIVLIGRKNKSLQNDGRILKEKNNQLVSLKDEADEKNLRLENTSRTMEEYIGELFNLNSEYINIMQREHTSLLKTVKSGRIADVEKALIAMNSPERYTSFFAKFDKCFLDIFPNFVDRFNELMQPQYRYSLPQGQLNPELRIFALMRLGVTETSRIAAFLHYTNQTVYNYRNRVKTHALRPDIDMYDTLSNL